MADDRITASANDRRAREITLSDLRKAAVFIWLSLGPVITDPWQPGSKEQTVSALAPDTAY